MKKHLLLSIMLAATTLSSQAQTAISATGVAPDASAMFDVSATDKGMLIPRVALTSTAASAPITSPLTSLLVYNTAAVSDVTPGYYYWNGTSWTRLLNGATNLSGSGTTNYLARWTPNGNTLGIGVTTDNGTNVGIGSASPTQKLTVAGNINKSGSWIAGDAVWGANTFEIHNNSWDGSSNNNYGGITGGHGYYYGGLQSGGGGGNEAASGEFYVSGKSMLMGNVGVGTTSPNFKTDIQQDMTMSGDINPNTAQLSVGGTSTVGKRMLIGYDTNGNGFGYIKAGNYQVAWTNLALQPNGGNVGIGTTAPGFRLHVPSGYIGTDYINTSDNSVGSGVTGVMVKAGDNYLRTGTAAAVTTFLNSNNGWIQNQNASAQSANFWISGSGRFNGNITSVGDIFADQNYGMGLVGVYASTRYQNVFAMGAAYRLPADGTTTGNLYGLAWSHPNAGGVAGNLNTHGLLVMENGTFLAAVSGSIRARDDMRAPIFYDSNNTGYYTDPNGTSEMNVFTRGTLARSSLNALQNNSPVTTRSVQTDNYKTGAMGWGTTDFNTIYSNWGSGFIDTWSNPGNAPGGSSHYVGLQGFHYNHMDGTNAYGFQMAMAGEANNRFFWRSGWPSPRPWVEMVHSGNIGSFGIHNQYSYVQGANFIISGTGRSDGDFRAPIFYDQNNTGYYMNPDNYSNTWMVNRQRGYDNVEYDYNNTSYYVDPNGSTYMNYMGRNYGWNWVEYDWNDGAYYTDLNGSSRFNYLGRNYGWNWTEYDWNNSGYYMDLNNTSNVYALYRYYGYNGPEYDGNNGGYYIDPNGSSRMENIYSSYELDYGTMYSAYQWGHHYIGWNQPYYYCNAGYYSCGWWNYSSCYSSCVSTTYYHYLSVNGVAYSYGWYNYSDGKMKENVGTVDNALAMVTKMRGVTYDWKAPGESNGQQVAEISAKATYTPFEDIKAPAMRSQVGFIAQEIKEVLPQAVLETEDKDSTGKVIGTHLNVNYDIVVPILVEAIKDLKKELDELKLAMGINPTPVQQTVNTPPTGANSMTPGKVNNNKVSVADAVKLLEDNLKFMTKEHQEQMKDFINEIKASDKLTPEQAGKVLEFRNNIQEFQKNNQ